MPNSTQLVSQLVVLPLVVYEKIKRWISKETLKLYSRSMFFARILNKTENPSKDALDKTDRRVTRLVWLEKSLKCGWNAW